VAVDMDTGGDRIRRYLERLEYIFQHLEVPPGYESVAEAVRSKLSSAVEACEKGLGAIAEGEVMVAREYLYECEYLFNDARRLLEAYYYLIVERYPVFAEVVREALGIPSEVELAVMGEDARFLLSRFREEELRAERREEES